MKIMNRLTVKKLKEALKDVPDDLEVELWSDSGVDQCDYDDCEVVIEDAYRHRYELPEGKTFEDGSSVDDCFVIYANWEEE
jgi:hypothetical protein